jgi:hypothetical protein
LAFEKNGRDSLPSPQEVLMSAGFSIVMGQRRHRRDTGR